MFTSLRIGALSGVAAVAIAVAPVEVFPSAHASAGRPSALTHAPTGRPAGAGHRVRVTVTLKVAGRVALVASRYRAELAGAPSAKSRRQLRHETPLSVYRYAAGQDLNRRLALTSIAAAAQRAAVHEIAAYRAIRALGGEVVEVSTTGATITAMLSRRCIAALGRRPDVAAVTRTRPPRPLDIGQNSLSVGAPTWWNAGFTGGRGVADIPATFAVNQDAVMRSHPAFAGLEFETPSGAVEPPNPSTTRHGTALLSIAAAQGPTGCPLCAPGDAEEFGVARGVSKVLDPTGAGAELDWAAGVPYYWYDSDVGAWRLQPGAPDPAQVINYSRGDDTSSDDSLTAQVMDATVENYGTSITVAAGNSGPAPNTINDPALAYNVIGVGAFSGGGTTTPSDDTVFGWSSRGPTVAGRKKPDLVAVGDGGLAYSNYQATGQLWKYDTGTSYSAPQVGAGAILLAGAGIRDPKLVKAILIDSARPGRANSAAPMGTQTGWLPDWGWGEMDLDAAYRERYNFARDEVPADGARFFRATTQAAGDRATLVWNRRIADCKPLRQGCYYDTDSGFKVHTLSNLDLTEYDPATGAERGSSRSAVDNVEQVRSPGPASVIYKVAANGPIDGPAAEPFALAATRQLTPLVTPKPSTVIVAGDGGAVQPGTPVTVTATVANPSPDLTAEDAHVTLSLPPGIELLSGAPTQDAGTLQPAGTAGDRATVTWMVRGTGAGAKQLIASTEASRYGTTFRSSAVEELTVAAPVEQPAGDPASTAPANWGTGGGGGATGIPLPLPQTQVPPRPPALQRPDLRLTSIRRRGHTLELRGTVAQGANGLIVATLAARVNGHRRTARATAYAHLRRFRLAVKIPRGARRSALTVTYARDRHFATQTRRATVRSR